MSQQQAEAAEVKADVNQSAVGSDGSEADEIAAALAAVEGGENPANDDTGASGQPKVAPKSDGEQKNEAAEEKEPEGPAAKGWAAVRKREQRLAKEAKAFKEQQQSFQARMQDIEARQKAIEERESRLVSDPVAVLREQGITFDDLARRQLLDGKPSEQELARRGSEKQAGEVKTLEEKLSRVEKLLEKQNEDKLIGEYKGSIKTTLAGDEFALLRSYPDAENEIFEFADKYARQTGQVLQPAEAAGKLQAEWQKQLRALASHQIVRDLLLGNGNGPQAKQQAAGGHSQVPQRMGASPRTLTNNLAATPAAGEPDFDSLSEDDQIQAALRLVQDA